VARERNRWDSGLVARYFRSKTDEMAAIVTTISCSLCSGSAVAQS